MTLQFCLGVYSPNKLSHRSIKGHVQKCLSWLYPWWWYRVWIFEAIFVSIIQGPKRWSMVDIHHGVLSSSYEQKVRYKHGIANNYKEYKAWKKVKNRIIYYTTKHVFWEQNKQTKRFILKIIAYRVE